MSDYGDDILDPPELNDIGVRFIGRDKAVVEMKRENGIHWSQRQALGYSPPAREPYELGDEMADHSDDQEYNNEKEQV